MNRNELFTYIYIKSDSACQYIALCYNHYMLCKDDKDELSQSLFAIEFAHHMRRHCGGSFYYRNELYSTYSKLTGLDVGHIALVAGGEKEPCETILNLMNAERIEVVSVYYKEKPVLGADSSD